MAEATQKASILGNINKANLLELSKPSNRITAISLLQAATPKIIDAMTSMSRIDLIDVEMRYRAAFDRVGVRPAWATTLINDLTNRIGNMSSDRVQFELPLNVTIGRVIEASA